jgi:cysteinyl-tRNA synthetase
MNSVLGLHTSHEIDLAEKLDATLQKFLEEREAARKAKDFKKSDAIRDELKAQGWVIEDTPKGPKLKKI